MLVGRGVVLRNATIPNRYTSTMDIPIRAIKFLIKEVLMKKFMPPYANRLDFEDIFLEVDELIQLWNICDIKNSQDLV